MISFQKLLTEKTVLRKLKLEESKKVAGDIEALHQHEENLVIARNLIQSAAQQTQKHLEEHITNIVTLALQTIFDDPYQFKIAFVSRRNSTECDMVLVKDGKEYAPLDSCGYGVADVVSFALRIAYWKLENTSRNTLILDEPFRFCDKKKHEFIAKMLVELSAAMNIQFIIVTHEEKIAQAAQEHGKVFEVTQKKGVSSLKEI